VGGPGKLPCRPRGCPAAACEAAESEAQKAWGRWSSALTRALAEPSVDLLESGAHPIPRPNENPVLPSGAAGVLSGTIGVAKGDDANGDGGRLASKAQGPEAAEAEAAAQREDAKGGGTDAAPDKLRKEVREHDCRSNRGTAAGPCCPMAEASPGVVASDEVDEEGRSMQGTTTEVLPDGAVEPTDSTTCTAEAACWPDTIASDMVDEEARSMQGTPTEVLPDAAAEPTDSTACGATARPAPGEVLGAAGVASEEAEAEVRRKPPADTEAILTGCAIEVTMAEGATAVDATPDGDHGSGSALGSAGMGAREAPQLLRAFTCEGGA